MKQMLFNIFMSLILAATTDSLDTISIAEHSSHELILCRLCGHEMSSSLHIINRSSPDSEYSFNDTLFSKEGVLVQLLRADYLYDFPAITFDSSECSPIGEWSEIELWFPDYQWKACICPACGDIVGWVFKPTISSKNQTDSFFVLDLHSLVGEHCKYFKLSICVFGFACAVLESSICFILIISSLIVVWFNVYSVCCHEAFVPHSICQHRHLVSLILCQLYLPNSGQ